MNLMRSGSAKLGERGFTFVEVMIALGLSLLIMVPLFNLLIDQQRTYQVQSQMTNMRQNARVGLEFMTKELRMAGYGVPASTWPASPLPGLKIAQTPNATSITFYANLNGIKTVLSADKASGQTVLSVESTANFSVGDTIYIEGPDNSPSPIPHWNSASIVSKGTGTFTIDTDSGTPGNQGTTFYFTRGSTIHVKDTISYSFSSGNREITRTRNGTGDVLAYEIQNMILNYTFEDGGTGLPNDTDGDNTNDTRNIRMINIGITAQTRDKDPFLKTERTTTFVSDVTPLNLAY